MRVIIADDAVIVRQGVARLLAERGIEVVGEAGRTEELLRLVAALRPDVAVIDIRMPPTQTDEGLVAAREIRQRFPAVGTLVLSQHAESGYALELVAGGDGSVGYLLKDRVVDVDQLVDALDRIRAGGVVVEPALVDGLLARSGRLGVLTPREREVLALVAQGKTDRGIALGAERDAQDRGGARSQHPGQAGAAGGRDREPPRPCRVGVPARGGRTGVGRLRGASSGASARRSSDTASRPWARPAPMGPYDARGLSASRLSRPRPQLVVRLGDQVMTGAMWARPGSPFQEPCVVPEPNRRGVA